MNYIFSIGVGSSRSGIGKTTFIENIIVNFKKIFGNKVNIIAIKYTKTTFFSSIISESSIVETSGKDTARMKRAGANFVYWVKSGEAELPDVVERLKEEIEESPSALSKNDIQKIIIIEGNSLVRIMHPDVIIFLKDKETNYIKPSGEALLKIADIVIEGQYSMEETMDEILKIQQKKLIEKLLTERSNSGKISCAEARKIAEELNVPYIEVGRTANELKIKIRKCELGCF
ncbi:MAG: molybdopterin-guanine dinucleotide biosynthesis protein MobB [Thermodesulfovibrio sp.]|uniref:molybdopterin-guanine dinucleotide biosynthesis protein MobB n=1 Tax=unclassified Thermodesulfovibrio TaxID=2645936 RepID=UPI0009F42884|nr:MULTISPECIES: molybdopterin-guanine dinucleotide biosynthesis protein MobB [unclassified Thermodesulfovibrio]MDI1471306.1 molybdopterin-guanine dinucleotide biosynthesis protein MobB [Thermodesulfovibrio sp. 1176]MDI6714690.1 molybdopterin-guanine dinucleotide biosynthesis protein MobB [Thermodesulfovibrio sp.]